MKINQSLFFVLIALSSITYSMESPNKRERDNESELPEGSKQPPSKKQKIFSSEEIEKATKQLTQAVKRDEVREVKQALDAGANINIISRKNNNLLQIAMKRASNAYADPREAQAIATLLLKRGITVNAAVLGDAIMFMPVDFFVELTRYGGNFNDVKIQNDLFDLAHDDFIRTQKDCKTGEEVPPENLARESAMLLWLLLHIDLNSDSYKALNELFDYPFVDFEQNVMLLKDRLGPLLIALMEGRNEEALSILAKWKLRKFYLSHKEQTTINEAVIFAAAHGNLEILSFILNNLSGRLAQPVLQQALEATGLRNQLEAFNLLVGSDLLRGPDFTQALENTLMVAAAQQHKDLVAAILNLDFNRYLDLDILPVAERMEMLSHYNLPEDTTTIYIHLRDMLSTYLYARDVGRILLTATTAEQESKQEKEKEREEEEEEATTQPTTSQPSSILRLPPELRWIIASLLLPLYKYT